MTSREVRSAPSKYKDRTGREARWFLRMGCKNYSLHNDLRFNSIYVAWDETIEELFLIQIVGTRVISSKIAREEIRDSSYFPHI